MSVRSTYRRPVAPPLELGPPPAPSTQAAALRALEGPVEGARGDVPDFETLYDGHVDFVWRSARRLGVAERHLEDVVQEVFLVVHKKLDAFEGRSALRSWLYGITLLVVRNHRRTVRRKPLHLSEDATIALENAPVSDRERPDVASETQELRATLRRVLDGLPDDLREVLVMAELEQMSGPDIAAATGLKTATVYGRLRTARAAFDAALKRLSSSGRNP